MSFKHPTFTDLNVYEGDEGEKPKQKAFYIPKKGDTLSWMAVKAYGVTYRAGVEAYKKICGSRWNLDHLVYRKDSLKCKSSKATYNPDKHGAAWIALCPADYGGEMPVIWIPDGKGAEPSDVSKSGGVVFTPAGSTVKKKLFVPAGTATSVGTGKGVSFIPVTPAGPPKKTPEPAKAGMGTAGWVILVLSLGGATWYFLRKKKR
jgi:hypothetical protein